MKLFQVFIGALCLSAALPAQACRGIDSETQTYLTALPDGAMERDIVAKVEITAGNAPADIAEQPWAPDGLNEVRVTEAIRGTTEGAAFTVQSETHSCARDFNVRPGESYYIAGSIGADGRFTGTWRGLDPWEYWTLDQ